MTIARAVRAYSLVLGFGLLAEGAGLLVLQAVGFYAGDIRHNALHAAWGVLILALISSDRSVARGTQTLLVFGVVYTALAVIGLLVVAPFGLQLGPGENVFTFVVGRSALGLALVAQRASSRASISASSASTSGSTASTRSAPPR